MKKFDALMQAANLTAIIATINAINPMLALALVIAVIYCLVENLGSDEG